MGGGSVVTGLGAAYDWSVKHVLIPATEAGHTSVDHVGETGLLDPNTIDILGWIIFLPGGEMGKDPVWCTVGGLAASLVSTH